MADRSGSRPIGALLKEHSAAGRYLLIGGLTTLVNFALYFPLSRCLHYLAANVLAWVGAVVFAYLTNRAYVFRDHRRGAKHLLRQGGLFAAGRLFSLGAEEGLLLLFIEGLGAGEGLTKLLAAGVVTVLNYWFSKYWVFRKAE